MKADRHGYCEHNRRPPRCWECQCVRAVKAEARVAELSKGADADAFVIGNLNAHIRGLDAKIETARLDALSGPYIGGLDD